MIYSITNGPLSNARPTTIGSKTVNLLHSVVHTFTVANFTTETSPQYADPENDPLSFIQIKSLPSSGLLKLSGTNCTVGQIVSASNISLGNLKYNQSGVTTAYSVFFNFDVADTGSATLSGLAGGVFNINVAKIVNLQPSAVGNITLTKNYGESITFTAANFTTETTPAYADPEGDAASKLKVLSLPLTGTLFFNGSPVTVNQVIAFSFISSGFLTYNPDLGVTTAQTLTFDFAISDTGSEIFTT
jgi:hypothetical protein